MLGPQRSFYDSQALLLNLDGVFVAPQVMVDIGQIEELVGTAVER